MRRALHPITPERLCAVPGLELLLSLDDPRVHLVGGAVRDLLLGRAPLDLDLVVEGDLPGLLETLGSGAVRHERFGTASLTFGGRTIDVARARRESYPRPGALPVVSPAGIAEDLLRRDFTVNAVATPLGGPARGVLLAVDQALEDLEAGRLRVLHERSFLDDPTRLWRLVRYANRLGFGIETRTADLARQAARSATVWSVGGGRLGRELRLIGADADPAGALMLARNLELDAAVELGFGLEEREIADRAVGLLGSAGPGGSVVLAAACLGVASARELLERLAFPADLREVISRAASCASPLASRLGAAGRPSQIAEAARGLPPEAVALAGALGPAGAARAWLEDLRHVGLEIDGRDLAEAGVGPGPEVRVGLSAALSAKLDGEVHGREAELALAIQAARAAGPDSGGGGG